MNPNDLFEIEETEENEILEITSDSDNQTQIYDLDEFSGKEDGTLKEKKEKPKKNKKSLKEKWQDLDKKKKILIIVGIVVFIILIVVLILVLFVFKGGSEDTPSEPVVIVEKDNYRYENGKLVILDKNEEIGTYECNNKDEKLCFVAYYSSEDDFDVTRYVYADNTPVLDRSDVLKKQYVLIFDNKKENAESIILYDLKEEKEIGTYKLAKELSEDAFILKDEKDKYGIISFKDDKTNNLVDFTYDYLGYLKDSKYIVGSSDGKYVLIDMDGKVSLKDLPGEVKYYTEKYIALVENKEYHLYNMEGKELLGGYDFITFKDDYVFALNGKKLFAFDTDLTPLNIEAIKITNDNYLTKIIFDDKMVEKERTEGLDITINKDNISIAVDNDYKLINLYEGKLSKKYKNISYYDGVLYVYEDEAKSNLIGSYPCNNKNVIDEATGELLSCNVAKETVLINRGKSDVSTGYLPIYNNRYIFISDGSNNIVLWDFKDKKQQTVYKEVDAGYYNTSDIVKSVSNNNLIFAKKNTDNIGAIKVEDGKLTQIISFTIGYKSLSFLKDNILGKKDDGTYHLYTTSGEEITSNITIKKEIVDFVNNNYILAKNGELYSAYNLKGSVLADDVLKVEFFDKFYVVVDNKFEITINSYQNQKPYPINEENIDNTLSGLDDYKVNISGNVVTVNIVSKFKEFTVNI